MTKEINKYYQKFSYRIEKKITVQEFHKIKDYAKKGVYLYIIHDSKDNNRFLYLSSKHFEMNSRINPETFKLKKIAGLMESIHLKFKYSRFNELFFKVVQEKGDIAIVFNDIIKGKTKDNKFFKKYKTHTKKIALDNPDWYLEFILNRNCKNFKKKILNLLLYKNKYNQEIINHCISNFFILENPDFQRFNDHSLIFDEGKTGKSSLIGYMGEKVDDISVAGLYGSSDSKAGKFTGGLITTTEKGILIDETDELIKKNKGEKILSSLNSLLENGTYNYRKQFGQKIRGANQFYFMGNIGEFNFPVILMGLFGNVSTIGRRIGIITYNNDLSGFEKGLTRPENPPPFLNAISLYMSKIFNEILSESKFLVKLYNHKKYIKLSSKYKNEILRMSKDIDDTTTQIFFQSHKSAIDRIITRGLKIWIFNNIDKFIKTGFNYNNHLIYNVLMESEIHAEQNLINLKNICEHIKDFNITDKKQEINKNEYDKLPKTFQKLLKFFWENIGKITQKGTPTSDLKNLNEIKFVLQNYKRRGIPKSHNDFLLNYGLHITQPNDQIYFRIINSKMFNNKIDGLFNLGDCKNIKEKIIKKEWNKENISEIELDEDIT